MGNLCSIFHVRFKHLIRVIPSTRKAQLVDYILLGWQTSNYKLKGSEQKWFMKPYAEIVEDTGIPKSTLERYIKELHDEGFIERRQALYSRTKEEGGFEVKKGTYIHITDKLLSLITPSESGSEQNPAKPQDSQKETQSPPICTENNNNEGTDPLILRESYIRDLYSSLSINNIIVKKTNDSVDKSTLTRLTHQFESVQTFLYSDIKEELPQEIKKLVLGTFFNLTFEHQKQFSLPKQVAAEYLFSLLNVDFYLPQVKCFTHRNNILSKMIRRNQWKTPKGFYKHFYLGQHFKDQQVMREEKERHQKEREINGKDTYVNDYHDERLMRLEAQMLEKTTLIDQLSEQLYRQSSEEMILSIRDKIQGLKRELESLWVQQALVEKEIDSYGLGHLERCA